MRATCIRTGGTTFKTVIIKQLSKLDGCFFLYILFVFPVI